MADGTQQQNWIVITMHDGLAYWCSEDAMNAEEAYAKCVPNMDEGHTFVGGFPRDFGEAAGWSWDLSRPRFDELSLELVATWKRAADASAATPGPRKPAPQIPPEIWNPTKVDAGRAWAAVVAMCGGAS